MSDSLGNGSELRNVATGQDSVAETACTGNEPSPSIDFISGVIAGQSLLSRVWAKLTQGLGAAGLIVGQPFDVVKVRFQTPEYAGRYTSTFRALGEFSNPEIVQSS